MKSKQCLKIYNFGWFAAKMLRLPVENDETLTVFAFRATEVDLRADLKVNTESVFPRERG